MGNLTPAERDGAWIQTYTCRKFWPLDPRAEDIEIVDIAHALSNQCRFSGHTSTHYSVAQHCVHVADLLREQGYNARVQLQGLLHDAGEAYLVDLPSPVKHSPVMAGYRDAEKRLDAVLLTKYGVGPTLDPAVKAADLTMLATEARDFMSPQHPEWSIGDVAPAKWNVYGWSATSARNNYLARFYNLSAKVTP